MPLALETVLEEGAGAHEFQVVQRCQWRACRPSRRARARSGARRCAPRCAATSTPARSGRCEILHVASRTDRAIRPAASCGASSASSPADRRCPAAAEFGTMRRMGALAGCPLRHRRMPVGCVAAVGAAARCAALVGRLFDGRLLRAVDPGSFRGARGGAADPGSHRRPAAAAAAEAATRAGAADARLRFEPARAARQRQLHPLRRPEASLRGVERVRHSRAVTASSSSGAIRSSVVPATAATSTRPRPMPPPISCAPKATRSMSAACRRTRRSAGSPIRCSIPSSAGPRASWRACCSTNWRTRSCSSGGDTTFNESFATTVEREGVRRWLDAMATTRRARPTRSSPQRRAQFLELLLKYRQLLQQNFDSDATDEVKRTRKQQLFAELKQDYAALKQSWGGFDGYDRFFAQDLTNAHLAAVGRLQRPGRRHSMRCWHSPAAISRLSTWRSSGWRPCPRSSATLHLTACNPRVSECCPERADGI